jgi:hypothetical protein
MPVIEPDGMFNGDRIAKLSDRARLLWPWLFLASNGYGRIEINHRRLRSRVFSSFENPPTEDDLMACVREYYDAYLLFLYVVRGQIWGQWDTPNKCLPKYKTAADQQSPSPPPKAFEAWRKKYSEAKEKQVPDVSTEISEIFQKNSEKFPLVDVVVDVVGVGDVVVDVGDGAQPTDADAADDKQQQPDTPEWSEPDVSQIAASLVDDLLPKHPQRCSRAYAVAAVERELAAAGPTTQAQADAMRASHSRFVPWWQAERRRNPRSYIPPLDRWIADGDYRSPPDESVLATATESPPGGRQRDSALDHLRRKEAILNANR